MQNQPTKPRLLPNRLLRLRPGALQPAGWLRKSLQSLINRLDAQPGIAESSASGLDWEAALISLDARIALSWMLGDKPSAKKARADIDAILAGQNEDGSFGALPFWPGMLMGRALRQAYLAMGNAEILRAMLKAAHHQATLMQSDPPTDTAAARISQALDDALWLYSVTGKPFLMKLAQELRASSPDWSAVFHTFPDAQAFERRISKEDVEAALGSDDMAAERRDWVRRQAMQANGMNIAMGLKLPMLAHRMDGGLKDRQAPALALERLMKAHGVACGMWTCDPYLAGDDPTKAVDVHAAAEAMDSLIALVQFAGEPTMIEAMERMGLNLLPAAIRAWGDGERGAHFVDGIVHAQDEDTGARQAQGASPNANAAAMAAYARYASSLWMTHGAGLAALSYSPCALQAAVNGGEVGVRVEGNYPFDGRVRIVIDPAAALNFELWLYIPGWAEGATLRIGGAEPVTAAAGAFYREARRWEPGTEITLDLPMRPFMSRWFHQTLAVERGPLVFALPTPQAAQWRYALLDSAIGEDVGDGGCVGCGYASGAGAGSECHSGDGAGSCAGEGSVCDSGSGSGIGAESGGMAFADAGEAKKSCPPVRLRVAAAPCEWKTSAVFLAPPPVRPIVDPGEAVALALVPYGCTDTRIAQFPSARVP